MDIIRRSSSCYDTRLGKVAQHRKTENKEGKIMSTVKTVEANFTFVYVDKRRKYTCKDFGIKTIPYGEGDDAEADALPAYEDELSLVNGVLRKAEKSFNEKPITGAKEITIESISDEWISLYNHDEKEGKLTVEIEVAVHMNLTIQADNVPTNDWDKSTFISDKVKDVLSTLSLLSNGEAQYDYYSCE